MKISKLAILVSFMTLASGLSRAQTSLDSNRVTATFVHGARILSTFNNQTRGKFWGIDVGYQVSLSNDESDWVNDLHAGSYALHASYFNYNDVSLEGLSGSRGFMGSGASLIANLNFPVVQNETFMLSASPGAGFTLFTSNYASSGYPVMGSRLNFTLQLATELDVNGAHGTSLTLRGIVDHTSNGSFKLPNDGINRFMLGFGAKQSLDIAGPSREPTESLNTGFFEAEIGAGRRDFTRTGYFYDPSGKGTYLTDSASRRMGASDLYQVVGYFGYNFNVSYVLSARVGTDFVYYTHPFTWNNFFGTYMGKATSFDHLASAISVGADLWLNRAVISGNVGEYVTHNFLYPQDRIYWTIGGRYYLSDLVALDAKVRFQGFESSYATVGLAFRL